MIKSKLSTSITPFACSQQEFLTQGCNSWRSTGKPSKHGIHVQSVGLNNVVLGFEFPCLTVNPENTEPLRISDFRSVCPDWESIPEHDEYEVKATIDYILQYFVRLCTRKDLKCTPASQHFLNLYGQYVINVFGDQELQGDVPTYHWSGEEDDPEDYTAAFAALLPMPEAWFHMNRKILGNEPTSVRVDIAFWTGHRMVVVELVGDSHIGKKEDVARHRLLNSMDNVEIIYLHNDEVITMSPLDLKKVLPVDVWKYWTGRAANHNPLGWYAREVLGKENNLEL